MRSWRINVASLAAAIIAAAVLFLPETTQTQLGPRIFLAVYWPAIAMVCLLVYGITALLMSAGATFQETGGRNVRAWAQRYLGRLAATQYFTAVVALLAVGVSPTVVETEPFFSVPLGAALHPALAAAVALLVIGALSWLPLAVAAMRRPPTPAANPTLPELQLLHELIELLHARPPEPVRGPNDTAQLTAVIEGHHRALLEVIWKLATAISRLGDGVADMRLALDERSMQRPGDSTSAAPTGAEEAAGELRTATAALAASVARLEDLAAALSLLDPGTATLTDVPAGSRTQLSSELQQLLRDMAGGQRREPPR